MRATLLTVVAAAFLLEAGCRPPVPAASPQTLPLPEAKPAPASVVTIPEEFQSPAQTSKPSSVPATPRILFAVTDFQVKTESGIQGIMAGETVNVIREEGDSIVVQYGGVEFSRNKSFFSPTYVSSRPPQEAGAVMTPQPVPTPEPVAEVKLEAPAPSAAPLQPESTPEPVAEVKLEAPAPSAAPLQPESTPEPVAEVKLEAPAPSAAPLQPESTPEPVAEVKPEAPAPSAAPLQPESTPEPVETIGLAAPVPPAEPALPDENLPPTPPLPAPRLSREEKKMAALADSIRGLNEQIRTAKEKVEHSGKKPSRNEARAIERMKADRDELSRELTTLGKP